MAVETRAPLILLGNILPFLLGTIFFNGRVYSRAFILHTWGWDDWFLTMGWGAALANCIMACLGTRYGSGMHQTDVPYSAVEPALRLLYGTLIVYQLSLCFTKLSLCTLYLRVFTTSRTSRMLLWSIFGFVVTMTVALELVSIFQCSPVSGVWDTTIQSKCIDTIPAFYTAFLENVVVDVILIAFAIPKIMGLKMVPRQKYALLATVGLGGIPIVASLIRCVRVSMILHATDKSWVSYDSSIWSAVDANVSIICVSAPALKPLLRQIAPGLMGSTFGTSQPGTSGQYPSGRKSWLNKSGKGYELSSSPRHVDINNHSQAELANSAGRTEWTMSSRQADDDAGSEGSSLHADDSIMKSVTVAVTTLSSSSP